MALPDADARCWLVHPGGGRGWPLAGSTSAPSSTEPLGALVPAGWASDPRLPVWSRFGPLPDVFQGGCSARLGHAGQVEPRRPAASGSAGSASLTWAILAGVPWSLPGARIGASLTTNMLSIFPWAAPVASLLQVRRGERWAGGRRGAEPGSQLPTRCVTSGELLGLPEPHLPQLFASGLP